jgi:hypothetical protein
MILIVYFIVGHVISYYVMEGYKERNRREWYERTGFERFTGLLSLCILWPLLILFILVASF